MEVITTVNSCLVEEEPRFLRGETSRWLRWGDRFVGGKGGGKQGAVERRSLHWRGVNIRQITERITDPSEELIAVSASVERPVRICCGTTDTGCDICGVTLPAPAGNVSSIQLFNTGRGR